MTRALLMTIAIFAAPAFAQTTLPPQRPETPAPAANAPFAERESWCEQYASWFVASTPAQSSAAPSDVRQSHEFEIEFNSCKLDPQRYEQDTRTEAQLTRDGVRG